MSRLFEVSRALGFKSYLECLNTVKEEMIFQLDESGLKVEEMDDDHTSLVIFNLPNSYFDEWKVYEPIKFTVNLKTLLKALGKISKNDYIKLDYEYKLKSDVYGLTEFKEDEKIVLTLGSYNDYQRKKTLLCPETVQEEVPIPKIFFKNRFRMVLPTLKKIVEDFDGDHVEFLTDYDYVKISCTHDYEESVTLDKDNDNILEIKSQEKGRAIYDIRYFIDFVKKAVKVSEVITFNYSEDLPCMMDMEIPQGILYLYVAPCIGV